MRNLLTIIAISCGCATKPKPELIPNAHAEGTFLQFTAADASGASDAALAGSLTTACSGPCDRVYVDIEPTTDADTLVRVVDAAAAVTPRPRVFAVPPSGKRIELELDDAPCVVEVGIGRHGAYVVREGERLPPDPTCGTWDAAICRGDDEVYDWPRLRSEVGALDTVCVGFSTGSIAELPAVVDTLRQPRVRLVRTETNASSIPDDSVTAVIKTNGPAMQWCLDGEVAEEIVPMQATLRLAVHIDGKVTRAEVVRGKRTTPQFESCLVDVARKFRFDAPAPAPSIVEMSLAFKPGARAPTRVAEGE